MLRVSALLAFFVLASSPAGTADAQTGSQRAAAQALFNEGTRLSKEGDYDAACLKFEASLAKLDAVGTRGKLAQCYEDAGRIASAWAMWLEVGALSGQGGRAARQRIANDRARALQSRLSYITVSVAADARLPGLVVERDGVRLETGEFGSPVASDPGTIRIKAEAPDHEPWSTSVELGEGKRETIDVPVLKSSQKAAPTATEPESVEKPATPATTDPAPVTEAGSGLADVGAVTQSEGSRGTFALILGGAGLGSVATGAIFGSMALGDNSKSGEFCDDDDICTPAGANLRDSAQTKALIADIAIGVGIAAVAGAVILWLTQPSDPQEAPATTIAPTVDRETVGVAISVCF